MEKANKYLSDILQSISLIKEFIKPVKNYNDYIIISGKQKKHLAKNITIIFKYLC